jgi:hypothetical protein
LTSFIDEVKKLAQKDIHNSRGLGFDLVSFNYACWKFLHHLKSALGLDAVYSTHLDSYTPESKLTENWYRLFALDGVVVGPLLTRLDAGHDLKSVVLRPFLEGFKKFFVPVENFYLVPKTPKL